MSEDLFRDFWWLMFPIFGLVMAAIGAVGDNRRIDAIHDRARRGLGGQ